MQTAPVVVVIVAMALFVYAITKVKDASMRRKGRPTPAPEWARVVFVVIVTALLFACLGPGLIAGLR
jgi:hypothetical protein